MDFSQVSATDLKRNGIPPPVPPPYSGNNAFQVGLPITGLALPNHVGPPQVPNRLNVRNVESDREYYLRLMNADGFRVLVMIQAVMTFLILIFKVVLYALPGYYVFLEYLGLGIWGPLIFFITALVLTRIATKSPSGCILGTAMAFQICSVVVAVNLLFYSAVSLAIARSLDHANSSIDIDQRRCVFYALICLAALIEAITAFVASILLCNVSCQCCSRPMKADQPVVVFDARPEGP